MSHTETAPVLHEKAPYAEQVGIATSTMYRNWSDHQDPEAPLTSEQLRGNLALETAALAVEKGYRMVFVDEGSSPDFLKALEATGVIVEHQIEPGMSAGRRQALKTASALEGVEVVLWTEPEKVSIIRDCMDEPTRTILDGEADIVVPSRDEAAFKTYPSFQTQFEQESNDAWNSILQRNNLLGNDGEPIDAWIGPRFIKNDEELLNLFQNNYEFVGEKQSGLKKGSPDLWANALFLPLVAALQQQYRVKSVAVPYQHPLVQTEFEEKHAAAFHEKRAQQQRNILFTTIHFIRFLRRNPNARVQPK